MYSNIPIVDRDKDGFVVSFSIDPNSNSKIQEFFDQFGFVVIRDVLTNEECEETITEFFTHLRSKTEFDINNPETYSNAWEEQRLGTLGIMDSTTKYFMNPNCDFSSQLIKNRMNPNLYEAYKIVLKSNKLLVDHDRVGVMRPTKNVKFPNGEEKDVPEWKTIERWLHLDSNPIEGLCSLAGFKYPKTRIDLEKHLVVQGLITLTDAKEEDGGFHCVPGFHKKVKNWCLNLDDSDLYMNNMNVNVPKNHPIRKYIQKIPMRKGCALIWNTLTLHGNYPNDSNNFRIVQYCRMTSQLNHFFPLITNRSVYEKVVLTKLGERLFGLESWEKIEEKKEENEIFHG